MTTSETQNWARWMESEDRQEDEFEAEVCAPLLVADVLDLVATFRDDRAPGIDEGSQPRVFEQTDRRC